MHPNYELCSTADVLVGVGCVPARGNAPYYLASYSMSCGVGYEARVPHPTDRISSFLASLASWRLIIKTQHPKIDSPNLLPKLAFHAPASN